MKIAFQIPRVCNLDCYFCASAFVKRSEDGIVDLPQRSMNLTNFIKYLEMCLSYGFTSFSLSPTYGELFGPPVAFKMLDLLERIPQVEQVSAITNFTMVCDQIERLMEYRKLALTISVYGLTSEDYVRTTRATQEHFELFVRNMQELMKYYTPEFRSIRFLIRCPWDSQNNYLKSLIKIFPYLKESVIPEFSNRVEIMNWNGNWCGLVPDGALPNMRNDKNRKGICALGVSTNTIQNNGDVVFCGACDVRQHTVLGNLNKQTFDEIYQEGSLFHKRIESHYDGIFGGCCEDCSEFHPEIPLESQIGLAEKLPWFRKLIYN